MCFTTCWRALVLAGWVSLLGAVRASAAAPAITFLSPPGSGTYATSFQVVAHFDQDVVVTGNPTLGLRIDSTDRQASLTSTSGGSLTFTYQPVAGDDGLLAITGPLRLNGGTIKGADGTDAVLSFTPLQGFGYAVDTTPPPPPVISGISPTSPLAGQNFAITGTSAGSAVVFDGKVYVPVNETGHWVALLEPLRAGTYTYEAFATDAAGNRSALVPFTFAILPDTTATVRPTVSGVTINGEVGAPVPPLQVSATGTPFTFDAPGLAAYGLLITSYGVIAGTPTATASGVDIPMTADNAAGTSDPAFIRLNIAPAKAPVITQVQPPSPGNYNTEYRGWIYIVVFFDKLVTVTGSPSLTTRIGSTEVEFRNGTSTGLSMVFESGYVSAQGALTISGPINLNGGTIKDADGRDAVLAFAPIEAPSVVIDMIPPAAPVVDGVNPGMPLPGQGFTISGRAEPGATVWFLADLVGHTTADTNGDWSMSFSGRAPGTYTTLIYAEDAAGNDSHWQRGGPAGVPVTVTVQPEPPVVPPVVSDASVTGQVGVPITPVQVSATNNPAGFEAPGLAAYGLSIDASGLITGTPTASTAGADVAVTASNTSGPSVPATIRVTVAAAPPPPPPPPQVIPQTITFSSPVGSVVIGQPIALGAISSAGLPITYDVVSGRATLTGSVLTPLSTDTLIVRASSPGDGTYSAASAEANFGNPQKIAQAITADTTTQSLKSGSTVTLNATSSSGLPVTYSVVSGPGTISGNTLTLSGASGTVLVRASQAGSDTIAAANDVTLRFDITPLPISRLVNISTRLNVSASDSAGASIAGFVVTGDSPKQFLIRGVGPGLAAYGVSSPLATPQLTLYDSKGGVLATNSGWNDNVQIANVAASVGAFKFAAGSKDAALLVTLAPGGYTVQLTSTGAGNALIEVYDVSAATTSTKQLINISTRGTVGTGDEVLIGGFFISGDQPKRVLIRGVGPTLGDFLANPLTDAALTLYDGTQTVIARNDNWGTPQPLTTGQQVGTAAEIAAAARASGAFPLRDGSADAALLMTLNPGSYSVIITGVGTARGPAMVEVYEVP